MLLARVTLAGFYAGFINALAGGGSFLTLPALIAAGIPPVAAFSACAVAAHQAEIHPPFRDVHRPRAKRLFLRQTGVKARPAIRRKARAFFAISRFSRL
jgi:hypothetical protein